MENTIDINFGNVKLTSKYRFKKKKFKRKIIPAKNYGAIARANNQRRELERRKVEARRKKARRVIRDRQDKAVFDAYRRKVGDINSRYLNAETDAEIGIYSNFSTFKTAMKTYDVSAKELASMSLDNIRTSGSWVSKEDAEKIYDRLADADEVTENYGSIDNYSARVSYRPLGWSGNDYAVADITFRDKDREMSIFYIQSMPKNEIMAMLIEAGIDRDEALTYIGY